MQIRGTKRAGNGEREEKVRLYFSSRSLPRSSWLAASPLAVRFARIRSHFVQEKKKKKEISHSLLLAL